MTARRRRRWRWVLGWACLLWAGEARVAEAQLGALLSPGELSRAHAKLEGLSQCTSCHERGQRVTVEKCVACHQPIADRMRQKRGVHREVAGDCVTCHSEHAGADGELRPFDQSGFDHAGVTGFALDGRHAPLALQCAACHKARSFLTLTAGCASCHTDVHKGRLGANCSSCHSTKTAFKVLSGQFDHGKAAFRLLGAHREVACAACHVNNQFRGLKFATCTDCHRDPHLTPRPGSGMSVASNPARPTSQPTALRPASQASRVQPIAGSCTSCHTNDSWRTRRINHSTQTAFPLNGRHAAVDCAACHKQPAMRVRLRAETCGACHADPHKGNFKQDCNACHNETTFKAAPFDHTRTAFALTGKHQALACAACHRNAPVAQPATPRRGSPPRAAAARPTPPRPAASRPAAANPSGDFRGLKTACVSCHADVHESELGTACESCHSTTDFKLPGYVHPRTPPSFFSGQHAPVPCNGCHVPEAPARGARPVARSAPQVLRVKFRAAATECASCHRDVHLGQVGVQCERCHGVQTAKFGLERFSHATTAFALAGRHETIACALCHKPETAVFPAGRGTAVRLTGVGSECTSCHADVHLGQFVGRCEACHTSHTFRIPGYRHRSRSLGPFFSGRHATTTCAACHKTATGVFPAGQGTAVVFRTDSRCVACHTDVHRGALGNDCIRCHRP